MLIKSQLFFVSKVILLSALMSFFIKYGLDNWILNDNQLFLALSIILSPVLSLLFILLLRHKQIEN